MITSTDLNISNESYTKKDFYQIYPEILDLVSNLTNQWDPSNTNESDPGVILLKLLAFVADKVNYNIDKNILESYIQSVTQEEAMRKLTEMLGYNMKYYRSATCNVYFMWQGDELPEYADITQKRVSLPRFTTLLTNETKDVTYVLTQDVDLIKRYDTVSATAIEGEFVQLDINNNGILLASNIDDKNRFYLPEPGIAENGIWIFNSDDEQNEWTKVDNLNTVIKGRTVWKFGYDSQLQLPYIQFPDDYKSLMTDGLKVYYIRTSGLSGNIKSGTLTSLVNTTVIYYSSITDYEEIDSTDKLVVQNINATTNGYNIETIDEAYEGFKRIIGTFDTLVTCRDYANAIYNMVEDEQLDNTPIVSNCQVSDIRDELNYANTIVEYGELGMVYKNLSKSEYVKETVYGNPYGGDPNDNYYVKKDKINDFDLYIYPLNPIKNAYTKSTYIQSFKPLAPGDEQSYFQIMSKLNDYKTISHQIKEVDLSKPDDIYLYKNYYSLKAKIITYNKVNNYEASQIKTKIYEALYKKFNARQLEYGEEIPYDILLNVIQNADPRIKTATLDEPQVTPTIMLSNGSEKPFRYSDNDATTNRFYMQYIAKNVLGGKIPLFDYEKDLKIRYTETNMTGQSIYGSVNGNNYMESIEDSPTPTTDKSVTYVDTNLTLNTGFDINYTLKDNESLQLVSPRLIIKETYPMYTNYYFAKVDDTTVVPANTDYVLQNGDTLYINYTDNDGSVYWIRYVNDSGNYYKYTAKNSTTEITPPETFSGIISPNFDLMDSKRENTEGSKRAWAKKDLSNKPTNWPNDMQGMFSLKTSNEIAIKDTSSATITQTAYIYWLTNNNNTILFQRSTESGRTDEFEYILADGEYFFYTNSGKTDLISFGAGTRLIYVPVPSEISEDGKTVLWELDKEVSITTDDIISNGISAFANSDWIVKNFTASHYFRTQQLEIINLHTGTKIKTLDAGDSVNQINSSTWTPINKIVYGDDDSTEESKTKIQWYVKPILNLNFGPNLNQSLFTNQSITLYTSYYTEGDNSTVLSNDEVKDLLDSNPQVLREHIYTVPITTITGSDANPITLRSNIIIQKTGGIKISVHTIDLNFTTLDNLLIYPLNEEIPEYVGNSGNNKVVDLSLGISLKELDSHPYNYVRLPIYVPENKYALLSFYYVTSDESGEEEINNVSTYLKFESYTNKELTNNSKTALMCDWSNICANSPQSELTLKEGLNIIRVENTAPVGPIYLKITSTSNGKLNFINQKLVNKSSKNSYSNYGLNMDLFNIDYSQTSSFFTDYIANKDYKDIFFATVDIDNSMLLDVKDMSDPYTLFNYNNAINKFVLAELDTSSFDNIEIASSSKLK